MAKVIWAGPAIQDLDAIADYVALTNRRLLIDWSDGCWPQLKDSRDFLTWAPPAAALAARKAWGFPDSASA